MNQPIVPFRISTAILYSATKQMDTDELEFTDTFGINHWKFVVWSFRQIASPCYPIDSACYSFVFNFQVAGQFFPNLKTGIGRASHSSSYKHFWCRVNLGCETFREMNESQFRATFVSLVTEALERMMRLAEKKLIPVDLNEVRQKWGEIAAQYLAEPLPIRPPVREPMHNDSNPSIGVDYHFVFDTATQRQAFLNKLKHLQLSVTKDKSEDRYWCTLTDEEATAVTEELESKLIQACGEFLGEYDGWAAPPSFKPAVI